jgi:NAD(P)-dependent dehydrogenase (short-subunit alcohol dehydrogenase family)
VRVLLTGATGFIGRALIPLLQRDGHAVVAWVRSPASARSQLGAEVELVPADAGFDVLVRAMERCDAVVNLAGEPLMVGRWTAARRALLEDSRVTVTDVLVGAIAAARTRPGVFISGSDRGDETLTETSTSGDGFLAQLCREWELAAQPAEALGLRVVRLRTGVVLGRAGARWRACCRRLQSAWADPKNANCVRPSNVSRSLTGFSSIAAEGAGDRHNLPRCRCRGEPRRTRAGTQPSWALRVLCKRLRLGRPHLNVQPSHFACTTRRMASPRRAVL